MICFFLPLLSCILFANSVDCLKSFQILIFGGGGAVYFVSSEMAVVVSAVDFCAFVIFGGNYVNVNYISMFLFSSIVHPL